MRLRRKKWFGTVVDEDSPTGTDVADKNTLPAFLPLDYFKLAFYCILLIVPVYAIVRSAIKQDWLMMMIDALLVPVGLVHGLLLIFGIVS